MIAMFVTLIVIGAFIRFPLGSVPISMQFAFCLLATLVLGGARACACVLIYIAMGLVGLPVFASGGGIGYALQPSFGYLMGFLIGSIVCGMVARGWKGEGQATIKRLIFASFAYLLIVYTVGCAYMYAMLNLYLEKSVGIGKVLVTGCAIFLPFDAVWCVLMSFVTKKVTSFSHFASYRQRRA